MAVSLVSTGVTFPDNSTQTTAATGFGFKNRIINGSMVIDQRNAGASKTITDTANITYTLDRWAAFGSAASKFTIQQTPSSTETGYATRVGAGFTNYLAATVAASANVTLGATDQYTVRQYIEGYNLADLAYGTANAKTITVSFWVYSSVTGTFAASLYNASSAKSYVFTYTIPTANTWTQISTTIVGDTASSISTTTSTGLVLGFSLGYGSTYTTATTGSWVSGFYGNATGAVTPITTNSATFYITGVQLEKGSTATSFDYRPYGTELQLCQRYLPAFVSTSTLDSIGGGCTIASTTIGYIILPFKTSARVAPTGVTVSNAGHIIAYTPRGGSLVVTSLTFGSVGTSTESASFAFAVASGLTAYDNGMLYFNSASGKILFTGCEL